MPRLSIRDYERTSTPVAYHGVTAGAPRYGARSGWRRGSPWVRAGPGRAWSGAHTEGPMKKLIAGVLLVAATATSAFATDVYNQDQKAYKLTIVDGSYTSTKDVSEGGSIYGLCTTGPCTFKI